MITNGWQKDVRYLGVLQQEVPVDWSLADHRDKLVGEPDLQTEQRYRDVLEGVPKALPGLSKLDNYHRFASWAQENNIRLIGSFYEMLALLKGASSRAVQRSF